MRIIGFFIALAFLPGFAAHAQELQGLVMSQYYVGTKSFQSYWVKEVTSLPLKFIGAGIKSNQTQESLALVCVGMPRSAADEPGCDYARAVYWNPQTLRAFAFGDTWHLYDRSQGNETILTRTYLKKYFEEYMDSMTQMDDRGHKYKNRVMLPMKKSSGAITNQKDWNWTSSPKEIRDNKFLRVMNSLAGGYVLGTRQAIEHNLEGTGLEPTSMKNFIINPYMIRLVPNHKNHLVR